MEIETNPQIPDHIKDLCFQMMVAYQDCVDGLKKRYTSEESDKFIHGLAMLALIDAVVTKSDVETVVDKSSDDATN
jgi:hypothetical protein